MTATVIDFLSSNISSWNVADIKADMVRSNLACSQRGLKQSAKWAAEMIFAIEAQLPSMTSNQLFSDCLQEMGSSVRDFESYTLAKSYMDVEEYDRAAHFTKSCDSAKARFVHLYSRYLAGEKRKLDDSAEHPNAQDIQNNAHLRLLREEMERFHQSRDLDGFSLYLYGVILKKLDLNKQATEVMIESVNAEPLHWGAWKELSLLVPDKDTLFELSLPNHWIKYFFLAQCYTEFQLNEDALKLYNILSEQIFKNSTFIMAQKAQALHNIRNVDQAVEMFDRLKKADPFRLDNMETFSNLLYVKEMRKEMAHLAHRCADIDKYRVETCCIIGNYYSLRGQHEKAVLYFQRALKLNPNYLSAWTLMGHEYMELKHTSAAIQAYRMAIDINPRDYRAWYGLGQTYEILKMPYYCLYYYKQASILRPQDSRMVVALGDAFEKLDQLQEAKKCFYKAHSLGDVEGRSLLKLARLYEKLKEEDQAAAAYTEYVNETCTIGGLESYDEQPKAYRYLANYHLKHGHLDDAFFAAQKCTEFNETRVEGKALLSQIAQLRDSRLTDSQDEDTVRLTADDPAPVRSNLQDPTSSLKMSPLFFKLTP